MKRASSFLSITKSMNGIEYDIALCHGSFCFAKYNPCLESLLCDINEEHRENSGVDGAVVCVWWLVFQLPR